MLLTGSEDAATRSGWHRLRFTDPGSRKHTSALTTPPPGPGPFAFSLNLHVPCLVTVPPRRSACGRQKRAPEGHRGRPLANPPAALGPQAHAPLPETCFAQRCELVTPQFLETPAPGSPCCDRHSGTHACPPPPAHTRGPTRDGVGRRPGPKALASVWKTG